MRIMNYATRDVVTLSPGDSIDRAISIMEERGFHHLIVREDHRVAGMVSDRDILLSTGWMLAVERQADPGKPRSVIGPTLIGQIMSSPVHCAMPTLGAYEAARIFVERRIGALPIVDGDILLGILTQTDLLCGLRDHFRMDDLADKLLESPISSLMHPRIVTTAPTSAIFEIVSIFRHHHIRHVPVVENEKLVGILSDRDVRRAIGWAHIRDMQAEAQSRVFESPVFVENIMQRDVRVVAPGETVRDALGRMLESRFHSLPVVQDDRLVGIVTQTDFLNAVAREFLL